MPRLVSTAALALAASALVGAALVGAAPVRAQSASYGQYLVVIDDSGSMDRSDPRRLVEMASLALAGALEDGDQVMLVGLNELASGEAGGPSFVSPRELLPQRDAAEGVVPLTGDRVEHLGRHQGETPCRAALDRARDILNAVASAGAPQTLLMLTDGACNGGAVEPPERWLATLRSHQEHRFRFVLLMKQGAGRADRNLEAYGRRTGWRGDTSVAFDARSLLRAFADVLSFSRGLRYDDGGRVGLERTFAGARTVRILAIRDRGEGPIALERVSRSGAAEALENGPTYRDPAYEWSFRTAAHAPEGAGEAFAVRSSTPGVDVLV
ncbi:MAG: VWA domain-containing protein, partial [Myxococcota bacterium]|nr:VWA domain-containing protein [Myxococcota bacterium]